MLDAVLELFAEGRLAPSAPEVAGRAGVSLRSVFRYYEDTESLIRAALARRMELLAPIFEVPDVGQGTFADRVSRFVDCRLRLYREVAPSARVSIVAAQKSPLIADQLTGVRLKQRQQLDAMFEPELSALPEPVRSQAASALDTLFQFESVEHLIRHSGSSEQQVAGVLTNALHRLLDAGSPPAVRVHDH